MNEYIDLYSLGFSLHTNTFFSFYFFATFFHYLHVLAGIIILLLVANWLRKTNEDSEERNRAAEGIASYWHMVDIVWIVLLPTRSEERRVGKECRARWSEYDSKKIVE